ncbi:unnamed protein product [Adineta steineri]|uniref:Uncharacterized protein n=1 Tax=Adineta steineri TaxID=433720 RepID=A0A815DVR4_9BILA|nr:unnamed protein product [Adineta steineri]CAF3658234.1 unnamed protein product [Adineta steineri]
MDGLDKIIIVTICSAVGLILIIAIISVIIWFILRRKSNTTAYNRKSNIFRRPQYQRSKKFFSIKFHSTNGKTGKSKFNTSDSSVSLSFNPPHLINQNVKNLDKLSTSTNLDRCSKGTSDPIYTSSSSISTSMSNLALAVPSEPQNQHLNTLYFRFLNELNHILTLQQDQRQTNPLKYTQSCRRTNDLLPFDYSRSVTPSAINVTSSSDQNSLEPIYIRTNNHLNSTLVRKARLAQIRDDTIVLY